MKSKIKLLIGYDSSQYGVAGVSHLKSMGFLVITCQKDGFVIYDTIKNEQPDVVIVDFNMSGLNAIELIDKVQDLKGKKPVFFVTSSTTNSFTENRVTKQGSYYFLNKPLSIEMLGQLIKTTLDINKDLSSHSSLKKEKADPELEIIITDIIRQLGVPTHLSGYHYLKEAIALSVNDNKTLENIKKLLYPAVAKRFSTTPSRVERTIRYAIEITWDRGDIDILNSFFGNTINTDDTTPTNTELIYMLTQKVNEKYLNLQ